jgi:Arc/MetJ-type ribon-helix-helix transcriptional regulator
MGLMTSRSDGRSRCDSIRNQNFFPPVGGSRASAEKPRLTGALPTLRLKDVDVRLTPDQDAFIREAIATGRFHREEDAVQEAMLLWEERERRLEILTAVDKAEASLARGEGRRITTHEDVIQLAEDVKRRGMTRLAAEQNPR